MRVLMSLVFVATLSVCGGEPGPAFETTIRGDRSNDNGANNDNGNRQNDNHNENAGNENRNDNESGNENQSSNENQNADNGNDNSNNDNSNENVDPGPCAEDQTTLRSAIALAVPGETVRMCPGTWSSLQLRITAGGAVGQPLTLDGRGEVRITGASEIRVDGDYVTLAGMRFEDGEPLTSKGSVRIYGDYVRLTDSVIDGYNGADKKWVSLEAGSRYAEVDHNRFANKTTPGALLTVWRSGSSPQFHHIHHNHFVDYADGGGENGWETIRVGTSTHSQSDSSSTIEYNLFERCDGEIEIISVKSGANLLRGNTFVGSRGLLTLRHGKGNVVEDNVFLPAGVNGGGGIRIYDGNHVVRNNYIEGVRTTSSSRGGIVVHSGLNAEGGLEPALSGQWTPFSVTIHDNTIIDSEQGFLYGGRYEYAAWDVSFSNNLVHSDGTFAVVREEKALDRPAYSGESYWGASLGIDPVAGVTFEPVMDLTRNPDGLWLSPLVGAREVRPLSADEVGPRLP